MLVAPMPATLMDLLLGLNITASLLILLVSMQIKRPLDFAVFPSLILIATLFRLALNVSSTRLVLSDGFAGKVIEAFGDRKSTRLNSSHANISYAVFCLKTNKLNQRRCY